MYIDRDPFRSLRTEWTPRLEITKKVECRFCGEEDKISIHLFPNCPALCNSKTRRLRGHDAEAELKELNNEPKITTMIKAQRLKRLCGIGGTTDGRNQIAKNSVVELGRWQMMNRMAQMIVEGRNYEQYKASKNTKMEEKSHRQDDRWRIFPLEK